MNEGDPSRNVFVVKSGLVDVWLEKPAGGSWLVRCCFPDGCSAREAYLEATIRGARRPFAPSA